MGTHVPHQRRYVPGTMVLETTWHTPTGWLLVQDLLVIEPVHDGTRRPDYRRSPGRRRRHGDPAAAGHLHRGARRGRGQRRARLRVRREDRHVGLRRGRLRDHDGQPARGDPVLTVRPASVSAPSGPAATAARRSRRGSRPSPRCRGVAPARRPRRGARAARLHGRLLAGLAVQRHLPRPPLAQPFGAQRAHAQGAQLRAHRSRHGGGDDLAPRDARRGAQLGLPLHLDPRLLLHAALALPARVRLGGARVLRLHHRGAGRAGPGLVTCRSCTASTGART